MCFSAKLSLFDVKFRFVGFIGPHLWNKRTIRNLEFINIDVSGGYDQILRQVSTRIFVFKFLS